MSVATRKNESARVLFIDDSRLMRMCAQKILGQQFDLIVAESAERGWEILSEDESIQVVFTDLHMTGKSGYELLRMVRGSDSTRLAELPVILITGAEDKEDKRSHALTLGATDFITKPFEASELMARASAYADSGKSRQRLRVLESEHHLDPETRLGNRQYCEKRLAQAISFAARHDQSLSLMHLQLDGLGRLLDEIGQPHAERALKNIATTLSNRIRREDTLYRTGRERFTFILPATDAEGARMLRHRFVPDLESLGLGESADALDVRARFSIQEPALDGAADATGMLREGLAGKHEEIKRSDAATTRSSQHDDRKIPSIDRALEMLARGKREAVVQQLPEITRRLQPLLDLIEHERSHESAGNDGFWRID